MIYVFLGNRFLIKEKRENYVVYIILVLWYLNIYMKKYEIYCILFRIVNLDYRLKM